MHFTYNFTHKSLLLAVKVLTQTKVIMQFSTKMRKNWERVNRKSTHWTTTSETAAAQKCIVLIKCMEFHSWLHFFFVSYSHCSQSIVFFFLFSFYHFMLIVWMLVVVVVVKWRCHWYSWEWRKRRLASTWN